MPRSLDDSATPRRRATRQRATRKSVAAEAPRRRSPRKVAGASPVKKRTVTAPEPEVRAPERVTDEKRKAPTPLAASKVSAARRKKVLMVAIGVLVVGVGASAAVGLTDSGQIDVQQTIEARNERVRSNTATEDDLIGGTVNVPVQSTSQKPDGGLRGLGTGGASPKPAPKPEPTATSTATSSEAVATSTNAVVTSSEAVSTEESRVSSAETSVGEADAAREEADSETETTLE